MDKREKGKVVMDGRYEIWEDSGSLFFVKKGDRKHKKIRYNGKVNIKGKLRWITLFKCGTYKGKDKFNISIGKKVKVNG